MTTRFKYQWLIVTLLSTLACVAQQAATDKVSDVATNKPVSSGTVTGRVYLSDTKGPARKATVHLQPATTAQIDVPNILDQRTANGGNIVEIQARFDGSFSFNHVPAGDYYVIASCPGYVSPYLNLALAGGQPAYANQQPVTASRKDAIEAVLKGIPRVRVEPGQSAAVDVILERGAAVSGNVSYDDGSPAAGLRVEFLFRMLEDGKETWAPGPFLMFPGTGFNANFTDDRGNYRISGLPAGKYIVATSFDLSEFVRYISSGRGGGTSGTSNQMTALKIYSGNTPRLKDAAVVPLALGEEYVGEDLQFPLSKLHTIAGHIISAHDGHVINSGRVDLYNSDDRSFVGSA